MDWRGARTACAGSRIDLAHSHLVVPDAGANPARASAVPKKKVAALVSSTERPVLRRDRARRH
jgi:hypothetical protein